MKVVLFVCMCLYMYECMYVSMYVCVGRCVCACMSVSVWAGQCGEDSWCVMLDKMYHTTDDVRLIMSYDRWTVE